jgi:hypothetical protein
LAKRNGWRLLIALAVGAWWSGARAGAAEPPVSEAQLAVFIQQLGDADFEKREQAQAAILKAGLAAVPLLRKAEAETQDAEIRSSTAKLLARLRWLDLPKDVNYLEVIPTESVFAFHIDDLRRSVQAARKTAVGKLIEGPDLKPLLDLAVLRLPQEAGGPMHAFLKWSARFQGQSAGAAWSFNPMQMEQSRAALIAEITDPEPEKVLREFLAETGLEKIWQVKDEAGFRMWMSNEPGGGAAALLGRHLILGLNPPSVMKLAEGLVEKPKQGLWDSPNYKKLNPAGGKADLTFAMNFRAYFKMLENMPFVAPQADVLRTAGYDQMELILVETRVKGELFEDRFAMLISGPPKGMTALMNIVRPAGAPLKESLALAPSGAVLAVAGYLDGEAVSTFLEAYLKMLGASFPPQIRQQVEDGVKQLEKETGVELAKVAGNIKGDIVYWATLSELPNPAAPDLGIVIGCKGPAEAKALAENLAKLLNGIGKMINPEAAAACKSAEKNGRLLYGENDASPLVQDQPARKVVPYRAHWAAHGSRLFLASSMDVLEKRLAELERKAPGFDAGKFLPAELAGQNGFLMVLDLATGLKYGQKHLTPILAAQAEKTKDEELQGILNNLFKNQNLFSTVPPLVIAGSPPKDGVQESVIRTPLPYIPTVLVTAAGFAFIGRAVERPAAPPIEVPPAVDAPPF